MNEGKGPPVEPLTEGLSPSNPPPPTQERRKAVGPNGSAIREKAKPKVVLNRSWYQKVWDFLSNKNTDRIPSVIVWTAIFESRRLIDRWDYLIRQNEQIMQDYHKEIREIDLRQQELFGLNKKLHPDAQDLRDRFFKKRQQ